MKQQVGTLDAIPSKRLFLSIIADYDLNNSICELIDNSIDVWSKSKGKKGLKIKILLDQQRQFICFEDNAGGVKKEDLRNIVGPGHSGNEPHDETIGIFGVGTKRAVVALAQQVKIRTRFGREATYQVEFDDDWLSEESWELPLYEVSSVTPGATIVELSVLRVVVSDDSIEGVRDHISATYATFFVMKILKYR